MGPVGSPDNPHLVEETFSERQQSWKDLQTFKAQEDPTFNDPSIVRSTHPDPDIWQEVLNQQEFEKFQEDFNKKKYQDRCNWLNKIIRAKCEQDYVLECATHRSNHPGHTEEWYQRQEYLAYLIKESAVEHLSWSLEDRRLYPKLSDVSPTNLHWDWETSIFLSHGQPWWFVI